MINTSSEYKRAILKNREFRIRDKITFANGKVENLSISDFMSYSINEATSGSGSFDIGAAVIKEYSAVIDNSEGRFDKYDFEKSNIQAIVGIKLAGDTFEDLNKGTYRVTSATLNELTINIKAYDSMLFFDTPFSECSITFPTTLSRLVSSLCNHCGITFDASTIEMGNLVIKKRPEGEDMTCRNVLSYCAQIMGCYAKINHLDRLQFGWYDFENFEDDGVDGGVFDTTTASSYQTGANVDGGTFSNYSSGANVDGGYFTDEKKYHHFYDLKSQSINTDDIVVTGIKIVGEEENEDNSWSVMSGAEGYVLEISENPLIDSEIAPEIARHIAEKIVGKPFRPLSISCQSDPSIEAGDVVYVTDRRQNTYSTVITNTTFSIGIQKVECSAEVPVEKEFSNGYSAKSQLLDEAKKEQKKQLSAYDIAVQNMNQLAANTFGFFATMKQSDDGSYIAYRHDKPLLEDSKVVYKSGIDGVFITTDYQGSDEATSAVNKWSSAFDSGGNAVLNILSVIGINADWINAGAIEVVDNDGNVTFRADTVTGRVDIIADSFSLQGKTIDDLADDKLKEFVDGTYKETIKELKTQGDKKAETWYQTADPSESWTTSELKAEHVGDIWYNNSDNNYRYWNGTSWDKMNINPPDSVFDKIDGKAQIFVSQPTGPYFPGDLWITSTTNGEAGIKICKTAEVGEGKFYSSDWIDNKYYDDTKVNNALDSYDNKLDQTKVFNRLTNNGQTQGVFLNNQKLYLNASYMSTGRLSSKDGSVYIDLDKNEVKINGITSFENFVTEDDLGDYVTDSDLKTSGRTTINGSNITTGIIKDSGGNMTINLSTGSIVMNKGSINLGSGDFAVSTTGKLTANNAEINGTIRSKSTTAYCEFVDGVLQGGHMDAGTRNHHGRITFTDKWTNGGLGIGLHSRYLSLCGTLYTSTDSAATTLSKGFTGTETIAFMNSNGGIYGADVKFVNGLWIG